MRLKGVLIALFLLSTIVVNADKNVKCKIKSNGKVTLNKTCKFMSEAGGSFSLLSAKDVNTALYSDIMSVSVMLTNKDVAEVSGSLKDGHNSRWGEAKRSKKDRACWSGSDFEVCAK